MNKITLLLLLITSIGFSQTNPIDFEPSGNGSSWTWNVFEADTPALEFVANPNTTGNTSATVAKITVKQGGAVYAGTNTTGQGTFDLSEANSTVRIWVYKTVISDIGIKFEQGAASTGEIKVANTKINQWEEIIFDMSPKIGEPESTGITGLVVFPDFDARTQDNIIFFDTITFSSKSTLPSVDPPSVSAPSPSIAEADVLSIYSNSYSTNQVANFNLNAFQGGGTISEVDIESSGNKTIKIEGLTYYGAQWDPVDVSLSSSYRFVNLDYFATTSTAFNFYLIDATAGIPGGNAAEPKYVVAASGGDETIVQGEWKTISIPLEHFTNYDSGTFSYDLNDIIQWKFDGNGTLFIDNIYFSVASSLSTSIYELQNISLYPNPTQNVLFISAERKIQKATIYNLLGKVVKTILIDNKSKSIDISSLSSGMYLIKYTINSKEGITKFIKE